MVKLDSKVEFMLYLTDLLFLKSQEEFNKHNLGHALYFKLYTRADTPLTYRQLNLLDTDKLLGESRKGKTNWRKFSFIELVYFDVITELKKFGFKHQQLMRLRDSFLNFNADKLNGENNIIQAPNAIVCILGGIEITLCVDSDGNIDYFDPVNLFSFKYDKPVIQLSLNKYVNRLLDSIKNGEIPAVESLKEIIQNKINESKTDKELKLLEIVRNNSFSTIKVKKINGEISVVYAEKQKNGVGITTKEFEKMVDAKDFQNIELTRRDGKIVNYKIEETFKL